MPVAGADFHQRQQRTRGPGDDGTRQHLRRVQLIEQRGGFFAVVTQCFFPLIPEGQIVRPAANGLKACRAPEFVGKCAGEDRIVVQDGADIDHIHFCTGATQRQYGLFQPAVQLVALLRAAHVLVVLNIIEDNQVRTIWTMTQTTQLLAAACHLHFDIVAGENGAYLPDTPLTAHLGEIGEQTRVKLQLGLDSLQHRIRLVNGVHDDKRIVLEAENDAPQDEQLADHCGLCFTTRRGDGVVLAVLAFCHLRQATEEIQVQLARLGVTHIVRKVGLHKIAVAGIRVSHLQATRGNRCQAGVQTRAFGFDFASQVGGQRLHRLAKLADGQLLRHITT